MAPEQASLKLAASPKGVPFAGGDGGVERSAAAASRMRWILMTLCTFVVHVVGGDVVRVVDLVDVVGGGAGAGVVGVDVGVISVWGSL